MVARTQNPIQKVNRKIELLNFQYNKRFLQLIHEYRTVYNNASIGQRVREHNLNSRRLHNIIQ
jgi:hypothetical protein